MSFLEQGPDLVPTRPYHIEITSRWWPRGESPYLLSTLENHYVSTCNYKVMCYAVATHRAFHHKQTNATSGKINAGRVPKKSRPIRQSIESILKSENRVSSLRLTLLSSLLNQNLNQINEIFRGENGSHKH